MSGEGELWHVVEAKRDDGSPTTFQIRELDRDPKLTRIFVVEMPYPTTELSRLPTALGYRTLRRFEEQFLWPACSALGWQLVGRKIEDGSFFLYMYGASEPQQLANQLAPFDAALGFYDDEDPEWAEYATLRELLDQAKAMGPATVDAVAEPVRGDAKPPATRKPAGKRAPKPTPRPAPKPRSKTRPEPKKKSRRSGKLAR